MISFKKNIEKIKCHREDVTALITGASSGMGLLYANRLAEAGCNLVIVSNQEKELKEVGDRLQKNYKIKVIGC